MRANKSIGTIVFLPVWFKGKYNCTCSFSRMEFFKLEVGDMVTPSKPPDTFAELQSQERYKVDSVDFNLFSPALIATLEPAKFDSEKKMKDFLNGKSVIYKV